MQEIVEQAIAFWRQEFDRARRYQQSSIPGIELGTQEFRRTDCSSEHTLEFLFGDLTMDQAKRLGDPRNFIGAAIRTKYDEKFLRAEGFIYISPDNGPDQFRSAGTIDHAWSVEGNKRLRLALMHELGHVFGVQHSGAQFELMAFTFSDYIVRASTNMSIVPDAPSVFVYNYDLARISCARLPDGSPTKMKKLFNITGECSKMTFDGHEIKLFSGNKPLDTWDLIGKSKLIYIINRGLNSHLIVVYLTRENQVINIGHDPFKTLTGYPEVKVEISALFEFASGANPMPIYLEFSSERVSLKTISMTDDLRYIQEIKVD